VVRVHVDGHDGDDDDDDDDCVGCCCVVIVVVAMGLTTPKAWMDFVWNRARMVSRINDWIDFILSIVFNMC